MDKITSRKSFGVFWQDRKIKGDKNMEKILKKMAKNMIQCAIGLSIFWLPIVATYVGEFIFRLIMGV